jgi:hypothetical protein
MNKLIILLMLVSVNIYADEIKPDTKVPVTVRFLDGVYTEDQFELVFVVENGLKYSTVMIEEECTVEFDPNQKFGFQDYPTPPKTFKRALKDRNGFISFFPGREKAYIRYYTFARLWGAQCHISSLIIEEPDLLHRMLGYGKEEKYE